MGASAGNFTLTGQGATGIGTSALTALTSGLRNTAIGNGTLLLLQSGFDNVAVGTSALGSLVSANSNTAVGTFALNLCTVGGNTAVGQAALANITTGNQSAAVGDRCLTVATGSNNTGVGALCFIVKSTGDDNTGLGAAAGFNLTTGAGNLLLGKNAGISYVSSESNNILLANSGTAAESNVMRLGTTGAGAGQVSTAFIAGVASVSVSNALHVVINSATGQLGTVATTGDVVGPASSTDNALVRFDSTTGKLIKNGVITEDNTGNLSITASVAGATLSTTISNTSNTASSNALSQHTVAGTSAGDAFSTYTVAGTTNWSLGVDNSVTGDPFVIAASTALGTTNIMSAATTGEINYPLQPAFLGFLGTTALNKTGNGTSYTIGADALTEVFDQGGDFTTGGVFTAPVTGKYLLNASAFLIGTTTLSIIVLTIVTSNRNFKIQVGRTAVSADLGANITNLCDMDAADTFTAAVIGLGEAGDTDDISGVTAFGTFMSGYLAC